MLISSSKTNTSTVVPLSTDATPTMSAQLAQKRKCPHGTRATPARGSIRQISHPLDVSDDSVEVVAFAL